MSLAACGEDVVENQHNNGEPASYTVTPSAGANGSISPDSAQIINHGGSTDFTLTPDDNYTIGSISGTCGGSLDDIIYITDPIEADCTVEASLVLPAPQDLAAQAGHQVNLLWTDVPEAVEYCVYMSDSAGIDLDDADSYDPDLSICTGNADTLYSTTNLLRGTRYYFVVSAIDGSGGESAGSVEVSARPLSNPFNDTGLVVSSEDPPVPGEDYEFGRDAQALAGTLIKVGAGHGGFDFTKLDENGDSLPEDATEWNCVRDNHTGLIWEVKTMDEGLRNYWHLYTWYNSDPTTNGGGSGTPGGTTETSCFEEGRCDTEKFVDDVNALSLCGANDWRLPQLRELDSLLHLGNGVGFEERLIVTNYFPDILFPLGVREEY